MNSLGQRVLWIQAVILDIDGVLTDGRIGLTGDDADDIKFFHVRDGHGIKLLRRAGLKVGMLSGRSAAANRRRARELDVDFLYEGQKNKLAAFERLIREQSLEPETCLAVGDDVVDIPVMKRCGVAVAVADAAVEVRAVADWVTSLPGGRGAVREIAEWVLRCQGRWEQLMERYQA